MIAKLMILDMSGMDMIVLFHLFGMEKNNLKIFKPSFMKKDKKSKSGTSSGAVAPPLEEANVKMASEASKKAEKDRLERLRLQEQQDLAYAIALSKAEAASLSSDK